MENLSDKIAILQKKFYDLNNLFDLSIIATQASSVEDLIEKISAFISDTMSTKDVKFFVHQENTYYMVSSTTDDEHEYFQFENDDEGFWEVLNRNEFIKVKDDKGNPIYHSFWEKNSLKNLDSDYFKLFQKDNVPYFICSVGTKKDGTSLDTEELLLWCDPVKTIPQITIKVIISIAPITSFFSFKILTVLSSVEGFFGSGALSKILSSLMTLVFGLGNL